MYYIAICDDDQEFCNWLEKTLRANNGEFKQSIDSYSSGEALCHAMQNGKEYDLIFLDIMLQVMNGVDVGKYIRETLFNNSVQIIYVSFNTQYAMELFQNRPFDFLVKPIEKERVIKVVEKVVQLSLSINLALSITSDRQKYIVKCKDIIYAMSEIRKTILYTTEREYTIYLKLGELLQQLPAGDYVAIHKSYIVNWLYVRVVGIDSVTLYNNQILPISRNYRKTVHKAWMERMRIRYDYL